MLPAGSYIGGTGEYLIDICPFCEKRKHFYWNTKNKVGWCHYCHGKIIGSKNFAKIFFGDDSDYEEWDSLSLVQGQKGKNSLNRPNYWFKNAWDDNSSRTYLLSRNIKEVDSRSIPISYVEDQEAIAVEIDPISPEFFPTTLYRRFKMRDSKWIPVEGAKKSFYGFGLRYLPADAKKIVIFEGLFDLVSTGLLGYGVAILGSSINDSWVIWLKKNFNEVVLWLDPDKAGEKAAKEISSKLSVWGVSNRVYRHHQDPKVLGKDHPAVLKVKNYLSEGR